MSYDCPNEPSYRFAKIAFRRFLYGIAARTFHMTFAETGVSDD